jgi:hypothetical protein
MPVLINGSPTHALIVHAVVVLLPLSVLAALVLVVIPASRRALRARGGDRPELRTRTRGLLDEVYRRLSDTTLLDRDDLRASLAQMGRGEGRVVVPRRAS